MTSSLHIAAFGGLRVRRAGADLDRLGISTSAAVLVYLASRRAPVARASLAELIWPERPELEARTNLRSIVHRLRNVVGVEVAATRQTVGLVGDIRFDAAEFDDHLRHDRLREAWGLYVGEYLAGFYLDGSAGFESWLQTEQVRYRSMAVEVGQRLLEQQLAAGDHAAATTTAARVLELDPVNEPALRELVRLHAAQGRRSAAIAAYQEFRKRLLDEFAVEPEAATLRLLEQVSSGGADLWEETRGPAIPVPTHGVRGQTAHPAAHHPTTSFLGRARERDRLGVLLTGTGPRLVTLHGPGGIGKTRLALQVMEDVADRFEDARFVPLADVVSPDDVPARIAAVLGSELVPGHDALGQLARILHQRPVLLVMDNVEDLRPLPVARLLAECRRLVLLVTSRERLDVADEHVFSVTGLEQPVEDWHPERQDMPASVSLFVERARQVDPDFKPTSQELVAAGRLCRLVEGSPLAIELATSLTRLLTSDAILAEVERSLDVLSRRPGVADDRHASLRATFESSWSRLSETERRALASLAVFEGGFEREAAGAICGVSVAVLGALVDKSLLRVGAAKRFDFHPLARQFALERLALRPDELAATQERHGRWFLRFARDREEGLWLRGRREVMALIGPELANLRAAWRWAIARPDADELVATAWAYDSIYQHHIRQAYSVFSEAVEGLDETNPAHQRALGHVLVYLAHFAHFERGVDMPGVIHRALDLLRPLGDEVGLMRALVRLGFTQVGAGDRAAARATWREGLELARRHGTARDRGVFLTISFSLESEGLSPSEVDAYFERVFDEMERAGTQVHLAHVKRMAAWHYLQAGRPDRADALAGEVSALAHGLGDRRLEPFGYVVRRALQTGDHDLAERSARDALEVYQSFGNRAEELGAVVMLAHVLVTREKHADAKTFGRRALRMAWEMADDEAAVAALIVLVQCGIALDDPAEAARHLGVVRSLVGGSSDHDSVARLETRLRELLGDETFATEVERGERGGLAALMAS